MKKKKYIKPEMEIQIGEIEVQPICLSLGSGEADSSETLSQERLWGDPDDNGSLW